MRSMGQSSQKCFFVLVMVLGVTAASAQEARLAGPPTITAANQPAGAEFAGLTISPANLREAIDAEQGVSQQEWQQQYDIQKARRKSGLRKVLIGLAMEGGGIAMMVAGATSCATSSIYADCSGSGSVATIGALTALAGAVPFWWGVLQWVDANGDVRSLEATRPRQAQTLNLTKHQAVEVALGSRTSVGYRIAW